MKNTSRRWDGCRTTSTPAVSHWSASFPHNARPRRPMSHLALFRRWSYGSRRIGEVFFADDRGVLLLRRLVRGISRVYRGEHPETTAIEPPHPQGEQVINEQRHENNQDER